MRIDRLIQPLRRGGLVLGTVLGLLGGLTQGVLPNEAAAQVMAPPEITTVDAALDVAVDQLLAALGGDPVRVASYAELGGRDPSTLAGRPLLQSEPGRTMVTAPPELASPRLAALTADWFGPDAAPLGAGSATLVYVLAPSGARAGATDVMLQRIDVDAFMRPSASAPASEVAGLAAYPGAVDLGDVGMLGLPPSRMLRAPAGVLAVADHYRRQMRAAGLEIGSEAVDRVEGGLLIAGSDAVVISIFLTPEADAPGETLVMISRSNR